MATKNEKIVSVLKKADGKLAVNDEKTYKEIVSVLLATWDITKAPEVMLVNRMVSTWMKLRRVETLLGGYDLFFEKKDHTGTLTDIKINQLAYYLKSLDQDFRNYYTKITANINQGDKSGPDLIDLMNEAKK